MPASSSCGSSSSTRQTGDAAIPAASHHLPPPLHGCVFLRHLRSALSHDTFLAKVGTGDDGEAALKVVRVYALEYLRRDEEKRFALERACLAGRIVSHPHLLTMEAPFASRTDLFLTEAFCSGGDMFEYMTAVAAAAVEAEGSDDASAVAGTGLAVELVRRLARELLSAVHHLHTRCGLVHRNVKLETIYLDASMQLRLGGFGLCAVLPKTGSNNNSSGNEHAALESDHNNNADADKAVSPTRTKEDELLMRLCCGSKHYAAPELIQGQPYHGEAVDAWACGVVLFALLTGCFPFDSQAQDNDAELFRLVCGEAEAHLAQHPALAAVDDPQAVDLIRNLLRSNPKTRFTVAEALEHPFLA